MPKTLLTILSVSAVLAFAFSCSNEARADLILDVSGTSGTGTSTWMFSGSDTATSAGLQGFAGPFVDGGEDGWNGVGVGWSGVSTISTNISVTSSDAEVTIDGSSFNLSRVRYGNNLSGFLAISTDNSSDIRFNDGDVVSWSGSFDVAIDVDDVSSFSNNEFGDLDLQFTVIPEPSSFLLVGVGVAAVGFRRRLALGKTNAQE